MAKFTSEDLLKAMGLKVGDRVWLKSRNLNFIVCFSDWSKKAFLQNDNVCDIYLCDVIDVDYTIIQPKPILTEDEKVILKNLPKYIINIYRDRAQNLFVGSNDGSYTRIYYQHMFDFIKVGDGCYSIEELLKE